MGVYEHQGVIDYVVGITRNSRGEVTHIYDSRKRSRRNKIKNLIRYLLTGKKTHNTMTNASFAVLSGLTNGVNSTNFTYTAIGIGTTPSAATDTALQTEVKRKVGTQTQVTTTVSNDTAKWDTVFGVSGDGMSTTIAITEIGVYSASTGGTLLCHFASSTVMATISPNTSGTGDTFECIVYVKYEQGS
jgi:hypothetical protein